MYFNLSHVLSINYIIAIRVVQATNGNQQLSNISSALACTTLRHGIKSKTSRRDIEIILRNVFTCHQDSNNGSEQLKLVSMVMIFTTSW